MLYYKVASNQTLTIENLRDLPEDIKAFLQDHKDHPLHDRTLHSLHYTYEELEVYPSLEHVKSTLFGYPFDNLSEITHYASFSWLMKAWKLKRKCKTIKSPYEAYDFRLYTYNDDQAIVEATEWWALLKEHPMFNKKNYIGVPKHSLS